ncbi:MAG: RDD family protein [Candidatus Riflebacteria bacterium]|nr:RDD family protein [Candidatus Riflebacteria bacterium]
MLDTESLRDLLAHLSPDEKRECIEELSRLEISAKNAEEVYRIIQVFESGLDVNLAIQIRAVCRKLETQFPGKFSFDFLTSQPVIDHLRKHGPTKNSSSPPDPIAKDKPGQNTRACPFCAEMINVSAQKCRFCQSVLENTLCGKCGRHSFKTLFCVWCGALKADYSMFRPSTTRRAFAFWLDYAFLAASISAFFHISPEIGSAFILLYVVIQLFFMSSGTTLGKSAVGLRIIHSTGGREARFSQILLRETLGKLISFAAFGLGFLWFFFDENGQTWHDLLANSIVVSRDA